MAFASLIPLLAFFLLHPLPSTSNLLSPIVDEVCKGVECGKGTCKASQNSTFFFECDCQPGWKQPLSNDTDSAFKFLPCIVPNCTLDYSCSKAPAPVQEKATKSNESSFDGNGKMSNILSLTRFYETSLTLCQCLACRWVDCGGGSCNKTSMFTYNCECDAGYYNLLNVTSFPCFKECSLGMGCSELGISVTNSSSSAAPPALNDNTKNEGCSILQGSYLRVAMVVLFMAMLQLQ